MKISNIKNNYGQNFGLTIMPETRKKLISQVDNLKSDEFGWSAQKTLETIEKSGPDAIKVIDADLSPFRAADGRKACHFTADLKYNIDNTDYILKTGTRFFPQIPDIDLCCKGAVGRLISEIVGILANHGKLGQYSEQLYIDCPGYSRIWNDDGAQSANNAMVELFGEGKPNQIKTTKILK